MAQLIVPIVQGIGTAISSAGSAISGTLGAIGVGGAEGGLSIASILQGGATVLGIASTLRAGAADKAKLDLEAADAEAEIANETLKGIDRRTQARKAVLQAVGALDTAYAAGGVDLSFGTVNEARTEFFREGDTAIGVAAGTELSRVTRLAERSRFYRIAGKQAKSAALLEAGAFGLKSFSDIARKGY